MADIILRPASRLGAALVAVVAVVAGSFPASAGTESAQDPLSRWAAEAPERFAYSAQRAGVAPELVDALHLGLAREHFVVNLAWGDMTGDRRDDVVAVDYDFGPAGFGVGGVTTKLTALNGRDGSTLWERQVAADIVYPIELALGRKARTGVLVVFYDFGDDATTFLGIDHRGRTAYEHAFSASTSFDDGFVTGRNDIVSFDVQNSLRGRATEVLIGIAEVRSTPHVDSTVPTVVGQTSSVLIDGKSGELVTHAEPELGVGRVPLPLAAPDFDDDGLDDHVMAYVSPEIERDEETGLPLPPYVDAEFVRGRRGVDGTALWTSEPLDLADAWDAPPLATETGLGDQTRDGHDEVLLGYDQQGYLQPDHEFVSPEPGAAGVWSLSGKEGRVLWHRLVTSALTVDDVDGDRRRDVVLADNVNGDKRSGTRLTGASGLDAKRIYSRFFRIRRADDQRVESTVWPAGDLQPDRVTDLQLDRVLTREFENGMEWAFHGSVLVSGRNGRRLGPNHHVTPLGASVDGSGDDLFDWRIRSMSSIRVADGRTRKPLLALTLDIPLTLPGDEDYLRAMSGRLNRDRCVDIVGTLSNSRSTFAVGIDGGSGRILWSRRLLGPDIGGEIRQTRRVDTNNAC